MCLPCFWIHSQGESRRYNLTCQTTRSDASGPPKEAIKYHVKFKLSRFSSGRMSATLFRGVAYFEEYLS